MRAVAVAVLVATACGPGGRRAPTATPEPARRGERLHCPDGTRERRWSIGTDERGHEQLDCYSRALGGRHGPYLETRWSRHGTARIEGAYLRGKRHGRWDYHNIYRGNHVEFYDRGQRVGTWVSTFGTTGRFVTSYRDGKRVLVTRYDRGHKILELEPHGASEWRESRFDRDGRLVSSGVVRDRTRDGEWQLAAGEDYVSVEFRAGVVVAVEGTPIADWRPGVPPCDELILKVWGTESDGIPKNRLTAPILAIATARDQPERVEAAAAQCRRLLTP